MSKLRAVSVLLLAFTAALLFGQAKTAADMWIGTWKLNLAKSKYQSNPPQGRVLKFEAMADGMKATSDLMDVDGNVHIEFTAKYDGKDVVLNGPALGQTIAVTRVDANTFDTVQKARGTPTVTTHNVVSRDGKTLTTTSVAVVDTGQKITNISVYDRVN